MATPGPTGKSPSHLANFHDLRQAARSRLPRGLFEFIDRGTEDEVALRNNHNAFERVKLVPRVLVDVCERHQQVTLLGRKQASPLIVAPTGAAGLAWYQGELELAKAAAAMEVPFVLSTASLTPMEVIAKQAGGRLWFQLYIWPDREASYQLIDRAHDTGFEALFVTVDTVVSPNREYNARNGFSVPMRPRWRNILDFATHPRWSLGVMGRYLATTGMPRHENYPDRLRHSLVSGPKRDAAAARAKVLAWDELSRLRDRWPGKLILKGVLHPADAERAIEAGVDGIVVSNHGGRNFDSAIAPLDALPPIAAAAGTKLTILLDSGITRGSDVVKAMAMGANAVMLGRMPLWGAAAAGQAGARHALSIMKSEIDRTLAFLGCCDVRDLTPDMLALTEPGLSRSLFRPPATLAEDFPPSDAAPTVRLVNGD